MRKSVLNFIALEEAMGSRKTSVRAIAPRPTSSCSSSALTLLKPSGFARLAPGCASPIRALMPSVSMLRAKRYSKDATAQPLAAPRTPRDFVMIVFPPLPVILYSIIAYSGK